MKSIILEPQKSELIGSDIIRHCSIIRMDNSTNISHLDLWFQFSSAITPPDDSDCDSYLLAMLMDAMAEQRNIIVKGSVSKLLLSNLVEYQAIWNSWLPHVYSPVEIIVESIRDNESSVPGAVCAFSGGVDATFSVWRHTQNKNSYRSQTINLCLFVQGFDIPLTDNKAFDAAMKTAEETLCDVNLTIEPIKTNFKEISIASWEDSHACALVATLSNFKSIAGICIVGSSSPYNALRIPWGSSPISDHLLSSDSFSVMHDGASHNRIDKVGEIAPWTLGSNNLRVCWQGDVKNKNCGICEKCLRTQFSFLASDNSIPQCFPTLNVEQILFDKKMLLKNVGVRTHWRIIWQHANRNHIKSAWVSQLEKIVIKKRFLDHVFPQDSLRRRIAKKIKTLSKFN